MFVARTVATLVGCVLGAARAMTSDSDGLVARWALDGNANDSGISRLDAQKHGVRLAAEGPDGEASAASFDGRKAHLKVKPVSWPRRSTSDFTIALWHPCGRSAGRRPERPGHPATRATWSPCTMR